MDVSTDEDVRMLVESADRFFANRRDAVLGGAYSEAEGLSALWRECAGMGWLQVCVPVAGDGAGLGTAAAAALAEAVGAHLPPVPLAHGMAAAALLADAGAGQGGLPPLSSWLDGEFPAGVAEGDLVRYAVGEAAWRLDWRDDTLRVALLGASRSGHGVDPLIPVAAVVGEVLESAGIPCGRASWQRYLARLRALMLAEMLGAATAALALAVRYACERVQFGRPIGANQAVKHRLADDRMAIDDARLVLHDACDAIDAPDERTEERLAMAELLVQEAAHAAAAQAIQTHGAMGITWECPVHFHFKRVKHLGACLRRERDAAAILARIWELA